MPLSAVLKERLETLEAEHEKLRAERDTLKSALDEAQTRIRRLEDELRTVTGKNELGETQVKFLILLAEAEQGCTQDQISAATNTSRTKTAYHLTELVGEHYVDCDSYGVEFSIAHKGRDYLIARNLVQ